MKRLLHSALVITFLLPLTAFAQDVVVIPLDTVGNVGSGCMLRIDSDDNPHIIYYDYTNYQYKHAYLQDSIWHFDIMQCGGLNDYEIDNNGNIHAVYAAESKLFYYLLSNDGLTVTTIDSLPWNLRYNDSEIELVNGFPRIVCVQYMSPSYLIEADFNGYAWAIDTVCNLSEWPTGIQFKVFCDTNIVSFADVTDFNITGLYYRRWIGSWSDEETVWPDSVHGIVSMILDSNGGPWISISYDNGHDNYHGVVAYKTGQSWQWDYIDTSYLAPQVIYSQVDERPYLLLKSDTPYPDSERLFLAGRTLSGWEFEQLYGFGIGNYSGAFDSQGNLHFCFSISRYPDRYLYYGFRRSTVGINDYGRPENFGIGLSAYPNPLNSSTTISINNSQNAEISIFDITGRLVATLYARRGRAVWDATGFTSGVYFARVRDGDKGQSVKLILLK